MSHPSLFPSKIPTSTESTRTVQFARRLNGLIEMRQAGTLNAEEFRSLVIDLGVPAETAWFMELAIAGGLDVKTDAPELTDDDWADYEDTPDFYLAPPEPRDASGRVYCPDCQEFDGSHTDECMTG